ncbi:MAG TPA: cupin domain-containing protein, partial [Telluria sp.]
MNKQHVVPAICIACSLLFPLAASAEEGWSRTVVNRADLPGAPGMEVISSILVVQPGATLPRHFHNGIESGYVLEGANIQLPGK